MIMKQVYMRAYADGFNGHADRLMFDVHVFAETVYQDGYNAGRHDSLNMETTVKMDDITWARICEELNNGPHCLHHVLDTYMTIMSEFVERKLESAARVLDDSRPAKMARYSHS